MNLLAQGETNLGPIGGPGLGPFGSIGQNNSPTAGLIGVTKLVSSVIGFMTVAAGIWFMFNFIYGGYEWITSTGDKAKLQSARDRLSHAFIGLVIVIAAWAVVAVAGQFFGIKILVDDPQELIDQLRLQ